MRSRPIIVVLAAALVLVVGASSAAGGSPPEGPDLETMALSAGDFAPGVRVTGQGFVNVSAPFVAKYERYFAGARLGGRRLLSVASLVNLLSDTGIASSGFNALRSALGTPAGRHAFAAEVSSEIATSSRGAVHVKSIAFSALAPLNAGQSGFRFKLTIRTNVGTVESAVEAILVDRAIGLLSLDSYPRRHVAASTAALAGTKLARRFRTAFKIRNITLPAIAGTAQRGAALTADRGTWAGGPSAFTYQWNQCDASGATCTPLAGAIAQTYTPGTADAGKTLTVTVTATNTVSSSAISSRATPVVP